MRLIDADNFEDRMYHEAFEKDSDMQKWDSGCWIRYKLVENVLREQPTIASEPHWIPCKERLPKEERKTYWCCDESGYQFQARWTNNTLGICESDRWGWSICDVPQYSHVVAWMPLPPLPPPYTAEGSEK